MATARAGTSENYGPEQENLNNVRGSRAEGVVFVSPGVVALADTTAGGTLGLGVRDPDGHVMQLIEP